MHFGPTKRETIDPVAIKLRKVKKMAQKTATIAGCSMEIQIIKQQIARQQEEINRVTSLYMTIQSQFQQFESQRAIELSKMVNGGPTVRN